MGRGVFNMPGLVIKKEVRLKLSQEFTLGQAPQEHGLVNVDAPIHQGSDGALMRGRATGSDQGRANAHTALARCIITLLQIMQGLQQGLERARRQGLGSAFYFVLLKRVQATTLINLLGLIGEQDRIAVKRDAHFMGMRLTRAGVREVLPQDFVKFARAKGLHPARVVLVHVLRNTLIPLVTVLGLELGSTIAYAVVTESIFAWPGAGKLILDSINALDRPVVVAYLMVVAVIFVTLNLLVDVLYKLLDPRVRLEGAQ